MLLSHYKDLQPLEIPKPKGYYKFGDGVKPDVWFEPQIVWEVKTADLTISPIYHAGIGIVDPAKGISLRFPISVLSGFLSVVGSCCVSYQIPCCLSSRKETRLQCRSGHIATLCRASLFSPAWHLRFSSMEPYPWTDIFVLPAQMKSPCLRGRNSRMRPGLLVIWHVEPESSMNDCFSG